MQTFDLILNICIDGDTETPCGAIDSPVWLFATIEDPTEGTVDMSSHSKSPEFALCAHRVTSDIRETWQLNIRFHPKNLI